MTTRILVYVGPLLGLWLLPLACSRPVPVRAEAPAAPAVAACPPCECEACPACPVPEPPAPTPAPAVDAVAAPAEPLVVPEHLRPTAAQCKGACDRMLEAEARRVANRMQEAQPELMAELKKGLAAEQGLLSESCVRRCLAEFTVNTALCVRKFETIDQIQRCIVETSFPANP